MKIKVCGITTFEDAAFLVEQGVDYLGFIFHKASTSYLSPEQCRLIISLLRERYSSDQLPVMVGVFLDLPIEQAQDIINTSGLGMAQIHGNESIEYAKDLVVPILKVIRVSPTQTTATVPFFKQQMARWKTALPECLFLLDTYKKEMAGAGGTGEVFNWEIAAALAGEFAFFLSGGLSPVNIQQAVEAVHPFGVDVKSGLESAPGKKDFEKVRAFFEVVNGS